MDGACAAGVRGEVVWVKVARLLDGPRTIVSLALADLAISISAI